MGMLPGDDEFAPDPNLSEYLPIIDPALCDAVATGMVTFRDPQSFLPLPALVRERDSNAQSFLALSADLRDSYSDAVMSRADFQRFAESLGINVQVRHDNWDAPNEMGYTIQGAAKALAQKYPISARAMRDSIVEATRQEKLRVRNPKTGMPCAPKLPTQYDYRISVADLNEWLKSNGVHYELEVESDDGTGTAIGMDSKAGGIHRNEVMRAFQASTNGPLNRRYWDDKLGRPPEWLISARVSRGKPGMSARWDPLLVAHALLGSRKMTLNVLDAAIRTHFPELLEKWLEQTEDDRT